MSSEEPETSSLIEEVLRREVGSVGLNEFAARAQVFSIRSGFASLPSSARGWIHKSGNDGHINWSKTRPRGYLSARRR
jgi:hypothetical protein